MRPRPRGCLCRVLSPSPLEEARRFSSVRHLPSPGSSLPPHSRDIQGDRGNDAPRHFPSELGLPRRPTFVPITPSFYGLLSGRRVVRRTWPPCYPFFSEYRPPPLRRLNYFLFDPSPLR